MQDFIQYIYSAFERIADFSDQQKIILLGLICGLLIAIFLYPLLRILVTLLHEFGHTMVMLLVGATITNFSIFTAHVSAVGGDYTNLSSIWMHANGALFPLVISYLYIFYKINTF